MGLRGGRGKCVEDSCHKEGEERMRGHSQGPRSEPRESGGPK